MENLVKFISKLSIIAVQISKTISRLSVWFYRYLLSILTTYVKKNDPALEKVLTIIRDLKGVCIVGERG